MTPAEGTLSLVPTSPDLMARVNPAVEEARSLRVVTKEDVEIARSMGKGINALIKEVEDTFSPIKRAQDAAKKITLEQEKRHLVPLQEAKGILTTKMSEWDRAERARIEEQERIRRQEEERERQAALKLAQTRLDKLMSTMTDDKGKLTVLNGELAREDVTDEEAEVIRAQIRTIEARINTTVERVQQVEQRVEEVSQPVTPVQTAATVKTATGVSQEKAVTGINLKVFLRYLASDDCIIDPATVIKVQEGAIKQLVQKMNIPGVSWQWQAKTRF